MITAAAFATAANPNSPSYTAYAPLVAGISSSAGRLRRRRLRWIMAPRITARPPAPATADGSLR